MVFLFRPSFWVKAPSPAFHLIYVICSLKSGHVATTLVSTLFTIDPLCFDVAKAYDQLEHTATCSECESLIDALEEIIDTVRKTDGALDDVQKLRLISEVQYVALKVSRKSIRLQNREFKDYIEQIKVLNEKILTPPSPSKAKKRIRNKRTTVSPVPGTAGKKQRASGSVGSGTTTPPPPPAVDEGNLSASMGEESDSDSSNSDTEKTKVTPPRPRGILPMARETSLTQRTKDFPSFLEKRKLLPSSSMQATIQPDCSPH
ncbi:hypothetical protein TNCV_1056451 [Trichonephila clavipes]|nr:hypothetical protein TNCV_1056451 [Trichonephila clavipes]